MAAAYLAAASFLNLPFIRASPHARLMPADALMWPISCIAYIALYAPLIVAGVSRDFDFARAEAAPPRRRIRLAVIISAVRYLLSIFR